MGGSPCPLAPIAETLVPHAHLQLRHPNVVQLVDYFNERGEFVIVQELVKGGELYKRIVDQVCPIPSQSLPVLPFYTTLLIAITCCAVVSLYRVTTPNVVAGRTCWTSCVLWPTATTAASCIATSR